ncbi:hypothetical protein [Cupriavidus malaysiensis]|uniref:Uncharacterized protein n=1 Tax=Cupriavidus malaysiensis TaxID=367825 RepID=A0ABM6F711_9BURK|nr:hypothetical protein [Cupriavidus malaysiensis]AOZ07329.1 hypothetical protein BKK80_16995 [Cupriavidus malaysiensis]
MKKFTFVASIAVLLAAGIMVGKYRAPGPDAVPGAALLQAAAGVAAVPGVGFDIRLMPETECTALQHGAVAEAQWSVVGSGVRAVELWIQTPDGKSQLWERGGQEGRKLTGPWVKDGLLFVLVESHSHKLLAASHIHKDHCTAQ